MKPLEDSTLALNSAKSLKLGINGENWALSVTLTDRLKWLLTIVKLVGEVEGATRLQKLTFLVSQNVKELEEYHFYGDWIAGKFGPFSQDLADDVELAIEQKTMWGGLVKNNAGHEVVNYALTEEGMRIADQTVKDNPKIKSKIEEIVNQYARSGLMSLLHDVYYRYPQYTSGSTIKGEIARGSGYQDTALDRKYD